jgi:propanediol dehydratase small subunit
MPGLSIDDMRTLARHFRDEAKKARKAGDTLKAERFERAAEKHEEGIRVATEKLKPRAR